jgi:hypothetical protein
MLALWAFRTQAHPGTDLVQPADLDGNPLCVANGNHTAFWFANSVGILTSCSG